MHTVIYVYIKVFLYKTLFSVTWKIFVRFPLKQEGVAKKNEMKSSCLLNLGFCEALNINHNLIIVDIGKFYYQ